MWNIVLQVLMWLFTPKTVMRSLQRRLVGWVSVEYMPDRAALNKLFSIERQLRKAEQIHAYWLSGSEWLDVDAALIGRKIARVMLPDPALAEASDLYRDSGHREPPTVADIERIAHTLRTDHGAEVKFCRSLLGVGTTFVNPRESNGWVHLELHMPMAHRGRRPTIRLTRRSDERAFLELYETFDRLWNNTDLCSDSLQHSLPRPQELSPAALLPTAATTPEPSAGEKHAVARLAALWWDEGGFEVTQIVLNLLEHARDATKERISTDLFESRRKELEDVAQTLGQAVNPKKPAGVGGALEAFNQWFKKLSNAAALLYSAHQQREGPSLFAEPQWKLFQAFRATNAMFRKNLSLANKFPGLAGDLRAFPQTPKFDFWPSWRFFGVDPWEGDQPPE